MTTSKKMPAKLRRTRSRGRTLNLPKKAQVYDGSQPVKGNTLSTLRNSGLLARDEALRLLEEEENEEPLLLSPNLLGLGSEDGEEEEESKEKKVTGRELFTIGTIRHYKRKKQSANNGENTPHRVARGTEEEASNTEDIEEEIDRAPENKTGRSRKAASAKSKTKPAQNGTEITQKRDKAGGGEVGRELEQEKKTRGRRSLPSQLTRERDRRRTRQTQPSSDSDEITKEDLDEETEAMAAQLNSRGTGDAREQALEDYFTEHSGKAGPTSDHTLSRLSRPRLEQEAVKTVVGDVPALFQKDCHELLLEHTELYPYWLLQMESGLNILLYGLGSKKKLIDDFRKKHLGSSCHLVVNGYFPGLTMKQLLSTLSSNLLNHSGSFKSHTEHAQFITISLEKRTKGSPPEVFLLIHNIDGPMLRNEKAQTALSVLASSPRVHVIASVDHINSPLLWDQTRLSRFKWAWHDVTTFHNYREETSYENSLLVQQSGSLALSSLTHVMQSLTPNARKIFEFLARYQVEKREEEGRVYQGLPFSECYRRCRESFLVNSDLTLRAQLTEFIDHKLVKSAKGTDGVEYLTVPLDDATLKQFLSDFNS